MKRVLLFAVAAVLLALVGAPSAQASVVGVGWWSDSPTASAPEGGVAIGSNPSGPSAVAAVLVDLGKDGASRVSLSLHQSGGAAPAGASIVACVVAAFTPAEKGPIAEAPATACEGTSTPLKVSGDGVTWNADVTELVGEKRGKVGIALVPGAGGGLFDLQFDTVGGSVTAARPTTGSSSGSSTAARPSTSSAPSGSSSPAPSSSSRPAPSTFSAPSAPSIAAPSAATTPTTVAGSGVADAAAEAATDAATEVAAGGSVALPTAASTGSSNEPSGGSGQALGYVLLAVVIGVIGGVGHRVASRRFAAA